jgi:hemerythrin-like domain-containing protein
MSDSDNWLVHDHSWYEALMLRCQLAVAEEDWAAADQDFKDLVARLKTHMAMEEGVLYPAYEAAGHAPQGPTTALRREHDEIVRLVQDIVPLMKSRNSEYVLDSLTQLERVMFKHHEKEEDIFLPMASHILTAKREEILAQLDSFDMSKATRRWKV